MSQLRIPSLFSVALVAASVLAGCSSARLDPAEFDYYQSTGASQPVAGASFDSTLPEPKLTPRAPDPLPELDPVDVTPVSGSVANASHRVQKGESLYGLSVRYLGTGKRWREIADLNGLGEGDVRRLPVGKELRIPPR